MIKFAATTPHTPLLLPSIGKENRNKAQKTLEAFAALKDSLNSSQPDCVLMISPHGHIESDAFSLNINRDYRADLTEFGDYSSKAVWPAALDLAREIDAAFFQEQLIFPTALPKLDHGSLVPLLLMEESVKNMPILPLYYSGLDLSAHYEFGRKLGEILESSVQNIAVIASGDLAHTHSADAPAGYSPKAAKFDRRLVEAIKQKDLDYILSLKPGVSAEVKDCGLRSFVILLGILSVKKDYAPELLSYESPFGVGYAVIDMHI